MTDKSKDENIVTRIKYHGSISVVLFNNSKKNIRPHIQYNVPVVTRIDYHDDGSHTTTNYLELQSDIVMDVLLKRMKVGK